MSSKWQAISPVEAKQHLLYGVKGWLAVFAVGSLLGLGKEAGALNGAAHQAGLTLGQLFALDIPFVKALKLILTVEVLAIAVIYGFLFTKHPKFRPVTTGVMLCTYPLVFVIGIASQVNGLVGELVMGVIPWAISCAVWVTYLQRSERVRVTFEHCVRASSHAPAPANEAPRNHVNPVPVAMPVPMRATVPTSSTSQPPSQSTEKKFIEKSDFASAARSQSANQTLSPTTMTIEKLTEEDYWATAMNEVETGQRRPGLWAKAFAEADGDETKAKVAYLKARVQQLTDAATALQAQQGAARIEAVAKAQAEALARTRTLDEAIATFTKNKEISNEQLTLIVHHADTPHLISLCNSITGNTLLHVCAQRDMLVEVDKLLKAGADPQRSNNNWQRPGFMSKSWTTRLLISGTTISVDQLKRAAEIGVGQDGEQFTFGDHKFQGLQEAINYAIGVSKMPHVELRSAVLGGNWSTAKSLLESGVSPHGKDVDGRTLLDHAKEKRDKLLIDLLEYHGAE